MTQQPIPTDLVLLALERIEGTAFEAFANMFYPALAGVNYIPLGGTHDGGADGFQQSDLMEGSTEKTAFLQASIQADHRAKIRHTIQRLKEFGRTPKQLTYITSRDIPHIDREEATLTTELDAIVRIRDGRYIASHINASPTTVAAFETYLRPTLSYLNVAGNIPIIKPSENIKSPAVYVFLRQEIDRRTGKGNFLETVADSLILWALEGTDPDKKIFMTEGQILDKIISNVPPARQFMKGLLKNRLDLLSDKDNPSGREVRWHKKEGLYCLPYETRLIVEDENYRDEALRISAIEKLTSRAVDISKGTLEASQYRVLAEIALDAFQTAFEKQGIEFAAFLHGKEGHSDEFSMEDAVDEALHSASIPGTNISAYKEILIRMLRYAIYESSAEERMYLGKLSRTYLLLFSLNAEPRIVEYFQSMASGFYLYVGSDILVNVLSERHLREEDRMTTNLLGMLAQAGTTLILAEPVLDEVHGNLEVSDWEFINHFAKLEPYMTLDVARHSSKILVRAYFYAKLSPPDVKSRPVSWQKYIEQFCSYGVLHKPAGKEELKSYFMNKFKMKYASTTDLMCLCDAKDVQELANKMAPDKKKEILAKNDAIMIYATYGKREELGEQSGTTRFGFRTWWLTHETRVRNYTTELFKKKGSHYIIRPEFLLNFIANSPTTAEVKLAYEKVFPTLLGVKLSGRMREEKFHELLSQTIEASNMEESRLRVLVGTLSDQLKGDFYKQYDLDLRPQVTQERPNSPSD